MSDNPKIIRTPEDRFLNLPEYDFDSHYLFVEDELRMHYLDEGNKEAPIVLLLHGEPSWSFLYRKMISPLVKGGFRVLVPDLIGFGKSDKWVDQNRYSYRDHINWILNFLDSLELKKINLFCQDWGGLIGLRIVAEYPDRFEKIVASNTTLPTGKGINDAFFQWRAYSQKSEFFDIGKVLDLGTIATLSEEVKRAYNAPFPSEEYKAGARVFPMLVPTDEKDPEAIKNQKAWQQLAHWEKPFLTIFGTGDEIMKGAEKLFHKIIPGCNGQPHCYLDAGHFIQEEKGSELAALLIKFYH